MKDKPTIEWLEDHINDIEILPDGSIKQKDKPEVQDVSAQILTKREQLGDHY